MARTQHTYAKRQREIAKKRKAEEKRERRRKKKEDESGPTEINIISAEEAVGGEPEEDPSIPSADAAAEEETEKE